MKKLRLILMASLVLTGCITTEKMVNTYNPSEYAKYDQAGAAEIKGQAFLKTAGGEVRFAAGETVSLIPATTYSEEIIGYYQNYKFIRPANVDSRWHNHFRKTTADGNGNFEFSNLPAGRYYLECPIYWSVSNGYVSEETGHTVYKKVELHDSDKVKVILTD